MTVAEFGGYELFDVEPMHPEIFARVAVQVPVCLHCGRWLAELGDSETDPDVHADTGRAECDA